MQLTHECTMAGIVLSDQVRVLRMSASESVAYNAEERGCGIWGAGFASFSVWLEQGEQEKGGEWKSLHWICDKTRQKKEKRDRERKIGVATCQRWMAHPSGPALNVDHFPSIHHLSVGDMCQSISRVNTRRPRNDGVFISVCSESLCSFIARCGEKIWIYYSPVCVAAPSFTKSFFITILSVVLDRAGVTPTVLQCTTVRQEGPLPHEGTASSPFI